jgi:hypothetical protein
MVSGTHIGTYEDFQKKSSVAFSPEANYVDWATAHRSANFSVNFCAQRGAAWSERRNPHSR